jgi:amino acid adenylation domain
LKNILCCLEQSARQYPDRVAVADDVSALTYRELTEQARRIGCCVGKLGARRQPVAVLLDKTPACVAAFLGVAYSGNFYVVLDSLMPADRIGRIFETLRPAALIADRAHLEAARALALDGPVIEYEEALEEPVREDFLAEVRREMTERDPLYALYTSGSTGRPKGTVVSHRAVIAYSQWVIDTFGIDADTVFGSQTPFYFSMSVTDLYSTLRTGARLQIIPKKLFSFPLMLMEYMNRWEINTIYWVPSALCIVANWDTFAYARPEHLKKVLFAGEVMPIKQLNYWRKNFPGLLFANLFGPTETTDICTYYVVEREFEDTETLPIGRPCDNCRALVLDGEGREAETGELYVGGPFLADGYYNDPEKTRAAFVPNPLNTAWPETLYRTGDLVSRGEDGNLLYLGRRDFQIKHMGYRIELGEIEANAGAAEGISACVCVYDPDRDLIVLLYQGKADTDALMARLRAKLPAYMLPNRLIRLKAMPYNANGKIDRAYLKKHYQEL